MSFQTPITISKAIESIDKNEFLLPAIQREFVWSHTKIEWLFDSLMRNYPISSFLFWKLKDGTNKNYKFYKFISDYREKYKVHNEEFSTDGMDSFYAILDGQQRLTSLYIGLKGSFAYRRPRLWEEDTERVYPTRRLYLNIIDELKEEEDGRIFEFKFLEDELTRQETIFDKKWYRVGDILNYKDAEQFDIYLDDNFLEPFTRKTLRTLRRTIHDKLLINYFLEEEQNIDKALNIFIRINSGGEPLSFSDLLMSIAVANWDKKDARKEIHSLVDSIWAKGFSISKDFVLKTFLYLHSKDILFRVTNFSKENAKEFETEWENIRDSILTAFDLIKTFGFTDYTLTSKNAIIPIIYYIYHRKVYNGFHTKIEFKEDRSQIRKWLHIVLIKRLFGTHSDNILSQIRKAFTSDFENNKIDLSISSFPINEIDTFIKRDTSVGEDFMSEILRTQKDDKYAFSILALLFPNLDYKNNNFHKDHLHPASKYDDLLENDKKEHGWIIYNSIINLQLLDANENKSKQDEGLKDWVETEIANKERTSFLKNHLIPDVDFNLSNFSEFAQRREELLKSELNAILN